MKYIMAFISLIFVGLGFAGGAIYQYYLRDKPIIEEKEVASIYWQEEYKSLLEKYNDFFDYSYNPLYPTVEQASFWLDRAAYSHEHNLFDDDPTNDEFHQGVMDRYASIKALLLKLSEEGANGK